jgi:hypothetical protein
MSPQLGRSGLIGRAVQLPSRDRLRDGILALTGVFVVIVMKAVIKGEQDSLGERIESGLKQSAAVTGIIAVCMLGWWWASKDD